MADPIAPGTAQWFTNFTFARFGAGFGYGAATTDGCKGPVLNHCATGQANLDLTVGQLVIHNGSPDAANGAPDRFAIALAPEAFAAGVYNNYGGNWEGLFGGGVRATLSSPALTRLVDLRLSADYARAIGAGGWGNDYRLKVGIDVNPVAGLSITPTLTREASRNFYGLELGYAFGK